LALPEIFFGKPGEKFKNPSPLCEYVLHYNCVCVREGRVVAWLACRGVVGVSWRGWRVVAWLACRGVVGVD